MKIDFPFAGQAYSLLAAFVWSVAVILLRRSGDVAAPIALNSFKNLVAFLLLLLTMLVLGSPFVPRESTARDWIQLLVSGVLGLGVADTLFLMSLNRIGAGRSAIVDCFYSPCVIACANVYLHETIGWPVIAGGVLIGAAVLVGTWEPRLGDEDPSRATLGVGVLLGALAMVTMAIGIVLAKPILAHSDHWWAIAVRLAGGVAVPSIVGLATPRGRDELSRAFVPGAAWRVTLPAALVGTYLSMIFWILGMKFAQAKVAALLNQTSTVFTILLAALVLREPLTGKRVLAVALGLGGAAIVVFERT